MPPPSCWRRNLLDPDDAWGSQQKTIPNTAGVAKHSGCKAEQSPSRSDNRLSSSSWACACQHLNGSNDISREHRTLDACIYASCSWAVAPGNALLSTPCSAHTQSSVCCHIHSLPLCFFLSFIHPFVHSCIPIIHSFDRLSVQSFINSLTYSIIHASIFRL